MKTMPKVGDILYSYTGHGVRFRVKVTNLYDDGFINVQHLDQYITGVNNERTHPKFFHGRIVKKPRKCDECAKPKQLFYVGHEDDITAHCSLIYKHKHLIDPSWKNISTLALISTEEVKK